MVLQMRHESDSSHCNFLKKRSTIAASPFTPTTDLRQPEHLRQPLAALGDRRDYGLKLLEPPAHKS